MSNVVSLVGTNIYLFDAAERITNLTATLPSFAPLAFNTSYNTNNGLVSAMTCTNTGVSVQYGFDVMDRVTNIVWRNASSNTMKSFAYQYNNASMITNIALEDGTRLGYSYDDLDRLTGETRSGNQQYAISYGWDEVGNRLTKTNGDASVSYSYSNGCNRLTGWIATSTNSFADASRVDVSGLSTETIGTNQWLGQLYVSNSVSGVKSTPTVSGSNFTANSFLLAAGSNQIIAAIGDAAGNVGYATNVVINQIVTNGAYLYSAAGCVTSIVYSGAGFTNTTALNWNSQYQLSSVATNGVTAERNGFDALGRRFWNWDGTATNYFVYDGQQIIADVNATGGLVRSYVWGPGIDNLLAFTVYTGATAKTYFALTDHLGSVHALADETGTIVESYRFDAWGRVLGVYNGSGQPLTESAIGNRYLWQGREYSFKTTFYFFRNRFYSAVEGRWLSNDPIGISGGLNMYEAFLSNPVNYSDPFGLRDVRVYVWRMKEAGIDTVGHVMITENAAGPDAILSQFPHGVGESRTGTGKNHTLNRNDTFHEMGVPDEFYIVHVNDDKAFDDEACKQRNPDWMWAKYPSKPGETHCAKAAHDALRAGGVNLPEDWEELPGGLADDLINLTKDPNSGVRRRF